MTASAIQGLHPAPTKHAGLVAWVEQIAALTKPARVHWCDGSEAEKAAIVADLIGKGTLRELDQSKRPGCYYAASDPKDVARVESRTFICSANEIDAGPTNNWADPVEMRARLNGLFGGCMAGRSMYVVPFSTRSAMIAAFSASEPSHQWTRAGFVSAAICSTQAIRPW